MLESRAAEPGVAGCRAEHGGRAEPGQQGGASSVHPIPSETSQASPHGLLQAAQALCSSESAWQLLSTSLGWPGHSALLGTLPAPPALGGSHQHSLPQLQALQAAQAL